VVAPRINNCLATVARRICREVFEPIPLRSKLLIPLWPVFSFAF
jgi:hypothetical protein